MIRDHAAGGETHEADVVGTDVVLCGVLADDANCLKSVLRGELHSFVAFGIGRARSVF